MEHSLACATTIDKISDHHSNSESAIQSNPQQKSNGFSEDNEGRNATANAQHTHTHTHTQTHTH